MGSEAGQELSAQALVAAIERPRPPSKREYLRKFTDEQLLAAVAKHGDDSAAIAKELGVCKGVIKEHRRRLGVPGKKGGRRYPNAASLAVQDWPLVKIKWTEENVARLRAMVMQTPRPATEDVARAFGITISATQTAMSRFDITKGCVGGRYGELPPLSGLTQRKCMTCEKPFLSEGIHNRRCSYCKDNDHLVAA